MRLRKCESEKTVTRFGSRSGSEMRWSNRPPLAPIRASTTEGGSLQETAEIKSQSALFSLLTTPDKNPRSEQWCKRQGRSSEDCSLRLPGLVETEREWARIRLSNHPRASRAHARQLGSSHVFSAKSLDCAAVSSSLDSVRTRVRPMEKAR